MTGAAGKSRNGPRGKVNGRTGLGETSWGRLMEQRRCRGRGDLEDRRRHVLSPNGVFVDDGFW